MQRRTSHVIGQILRSIGAGLLLACAGASWAEAAETTAPAGPAADVHFEDQIFPILRAHCISCHGETAAPEGNLDLRQVQRMRDGGDSGPALVQNSRTKSPLYARIVAGEMPPEGKPRLTAEQIELIGRWIEAGSPTRRPEVALQPPSWITAEDRQFWSFQPLKVPSIPRTTDASWSRGPIDQFIQQRWQKESLVPSPAADSRMLLRRLSFVLIGLPPSAEDVQEFLEDPSPVKYEAAVDRLLASPQFGERWGRVWLDLVRYVDRTSEFLESADNGWLYRDWVIQSLNADRPYDDFVRRQLAADLLEDSPPSDWAALGFLGLSPTYWKELKLAPSIIETIVADEWDERVDAVTRTFLGLTVSCARCHNHKFDPVTIEDYYALAGVMANSRLTQRPLLPDPLAKEVRTARDRVRDLETQAQQLSKPADGPRSALAPVLLTQAARQRESTPYFNTPWAHVVEDASLHVLPDGEDHTKLEYRPEIMDLPVFKRGSPADRGDLVPRRFLEVLSTPASQPFRRGSGRAELANAIFKEAEPLAARVLVNRLWAQVFGRGLVGTTSDFGRQGDRPSHPELLDYLASRLIEHHWSLKPVLREIVLSATFQQTSLCSSISAERDPDGHLLSRFPRRRMEVEQWRDNLLTIAGQLDDRPYGPAAPLSQVHFKRRTLYGSIVRDELDTMLRLFDFPEASTHSPGREPTTTPLQQLFVLNGELLQKWSIEFAQRILAAPQYSTPERIQLAYQYLLQRPPTSQEQQQGERFLRELSLQSQPALDCWSAYAQVLLGLNEVMFLE